MLTRGDEVCGSASYRSFNSMDDEELIIEGCEVSSRAWAAAGLQTSVANVSHLSWLECSGSRTRAGLDAVRPITQRLSWRTGRLESLKLALWQLSVGEEIFLQSRSP